ncbi:hypothetical protein GCM10007394_23700 [Salinibacterium amurskyense]|nr:hypothetical protein GCM10007394_23700 [Salinibacterium amurskyense]
MVEAGHVNRRPSSPASHDQHVNDRQRDRDDDYQEWSSIPEKKSGRVKCDAEREHYRERQGPKKKKKQSSQHPESDAEIIRKIDSDSGEEPRTDDVANLDWPRIDERINSHQLSIAD